MSEFSVTFDQKVTAWERNTVTVEAESQKEAIEKVAKAAKFSQYIDIDDDITYEESVILYETEEPLSLKDNEWEHTIEILDPRTREVIWDNVDEYSSNYKQ